jgi:hypothetical protein
MPVELTWRISWPVLIATYSGLLSSQEYNQMFDQRQAMLEAGPERAILLTDLRGLEGFPGARAVDLDQNILTHVKIRCVLVVVPDDLYRRVSRAILDSSHPGLRAYLFPDFNQAIACAETLLD